MDGVHATYSNVSYPLKKATSVGDTITVFTQKIVIDGVRNNKYNIDDILVYKQNTLYSQIFKALIYAYLAHGRRVNIRSISVERPSYSDVLTVNNRMQPINGDFVIRRPIIPAVLNNVWLETRRGHYFRTAASHYLTGIASRDRYIKFEKLWRAFEQIVFWHKYHETIPSRFKDMDSLLEMRNYFETNPPGLSATLAKVDTYRIRAVSGLHWKQMIKNEFPYKDENSLVELRNGFVDKNKDTRMLIAYRKAIDIYKKEIDDSGLMPSFDAIINGYRVTNAKDNTHLLAVLLCKYCYFMRNKMFHGEVADFSFCFTNHTEDDKITDMLNDLLESAVNDLLNDFNNL